MACTLRACHVYKKDRAAPLLGGVSAYSVTASLAVGKDSRRSYDRSTAARTTGTTSGGVTGTGFERAAGRAGPG